jgi:predicted AlkP superfamily pyrophosphatase or phosphodiesterase
MLVSTSESLALACLLVVPACVSSRPQPKSFSVDPERRGFEMPAAPVVLFFVDGLRADVLEELELRGELPRLRRYLFDRAARVRSAVTSVPSVTHANSVTMLTGCWPSTHGVWSNVWFDRNQLITRDYENQRAHIDGDDSCATIFELMSDDLTAGIELPFRRGVKISLGTSAATGGTEAGIDWALSREEECDLRLSEEFYEIGEEARTIGKWPAFIALHLPAVDQIGHDHGSDGVEYREAVANLDLAIGKVLEAFAYGGMLEQLTIVLTSDHGHLTTPRSLALDRYLPEVLGMPVLVSSQNDGEDSFLARWERYSPQRVVVSVNGAREASVHLRVGESWSERPSLAEILDFPSANGEHSSEALPARLLRSQAIDLVVVRASEQKAYVYSRRGAAEIERVVDGKDEPSFRYKRLSDADPLEYDGDEHLQRWIETGGHTSREWLEATADHRHPDLVPQLVTSFDHPRSGDLILFAAPTWDFSEKYFGGHGGVEREEMIVPLYLAGPDIRAGVEIAAARLVDIAPTLLELAGVRVPPTQHFDGISLAPRLR